MKADRIRKLLPFTGEESIICVWPVAAISLCHLVPEGEGFLVVDGADRPGERPFFKVSCELRRNDAIGLSIITDGEQWGELCNTRGDSWLAGEGMLSPADRENLNAYIQYCLAGGFVC